jgi:hypothetical protein
MTTGPRVFGWVRGRRWVQRLTLAGVAAAPLLVPKAPAHAQQPAPAAGQPAAPAASDYSRRVVAYVHGNHPITREDLGEFLIARGGMDRVELLVNRMVIEVEARRLGITVTALEIDAGLVQDLRGIGVTAEEFEKVVLPRYGKTLFEWQVDVIRPRLLLCKMCPKVTVAEEELQRAYESKYGQKREAQIIVWPKSDPLPPDVKQIVRANPVEFDKLAARQPDKGLAAAGGRVVPIGRHIEGEDPKAEAALFGLQKEGDVSEWFETANAQMVIKCLAIIPARTDVPFEKARPELERELAEKKQNAQIPVVFEELKKRANPTLTQQVPVPPQPPAAPGAQPSPPPVRVPCQDPKVLAFIYGSYPITREDLGEFLIARGGYEKLDLLVNKRIIEFEAARRQVAVSPQEIDATLTDDLMGLGLYKEPPAGATRDDAIKQMKHDFVTVILPRYGKTLYEWEEDVIKPKLLLGKMCCDRVKVTEDDLNRAVENKFGEKRQAKIIIWPKEQFRVAQKKWDEARQGTTAEERNANFDRVAREQQDPNLASAAGLITPMGRYTDADSPVVENVLFSLQVGEVSQLFETPAGIMCVKCVAILPRTADVPLAQVRPALEKEVFEKKMAKAIPAFFAELKRVANPNVLLKGPPSAAENRDGVNHLINQAGGPPPGAVPPPPMK